VSIYIQIAMHRAAFMALAGIILESEMSVDESAMELSRAESFPLSTLLCAGVVRSALCVARM
jgi:hypothetical protein